MRRILRGLIVCFCLLASADLFAAAPKVTSFTPTSGAAGTTVTLTGTSFTGATAVKFNGKATSSYTVVSATSIKAVAPTGVTTGKLSVTTAGGTATSTGSFTVLAAPTITTQPANRAVTLGLTATFTVVATGTAPLTYQWSKNGAAISGATSASYATPATQTTDNGSIFTVTVTNAYGSVVSSPATLTLNLPPTITTQPANQNVNIGSTAGFTVAASGTGTLTYQWSKNGISIIGAISASYTTPATGTGDNAATFTVKVTNAYGTVTSAVAILTVSVLPPTTPVITAPNPVTATQAGYTATVPAQAGCTYAWTVNGGTITAGSTTTKITFTPSGTRAMTTARAGHAAVLLSDGRILVTGGTDSGNTVLASAEIFNPAQGVFSPTTTPMASRRVNHTTTLLTDGRVLIVGGFDETFTTLASAEIFDPATGSFSAVAGALATARGYQTATLLPSGKVLLLGGWNTSGGVLASAELFDPIADTFSGPMASLASARLSHTATILADGTVLITGGSFDGPHPLATAEIFDPSTNAFHALVGSMASARMSHTASLLLDGRVLLAGGSDGYSRLSSAERFDPVSGLFEATASPMVSARDKHTATLLPNGQVLLVGGSGPEGSLAGGDLFDPLANSFTAASGSMAVPRECFTATLASNGQVLLVGGYNYSFATGSSTTHASLDIYDPATPLLGYISSTLGCTVTNSLGLASQPGTLKMLVLPALATPTITAQTSVVTGRGGYTASVPAQYGCTYTWTITNGTITNGAGTPAVTFSAGVVGTSLKLSCVVANAAGSSKTANATLTVAPSFLTLTPSTALLPPGGQQAFTANQPVDWSLDAGSITYSSTSATYKASVYGTDLGVGTYTLTATSRADSSLSATAYITVFVTGSPIVNSFSASPGSIHAGQSTTLNWTESNAVVLNLDPYVGPLSGNSVTVTPTQATTYTLSASNELGTVTSRLTVGVDLVPSITDFVASPSQITAGGTTQFSAAFMNGTGQINPGAHPILSGATVPAQLEGTTVYTLAVTNPYGATATTDARVDVTGPGAFLPTLSLAAPHPSAMSTRLSDGRVFLTGGTPSNGTLVQFFDPEIGVFQLGTYLREGRGRNTAARLADDRVLLWGGALPGTNITFLNSYEIIDPGRGSSSVHAITSSGLGGVSYTNSIVYRCDHTATRLGDGRVLIMGGRSLRDGVNYSAWAGDRVTLATALLVDPNANQGPVVGFSVTGSMGTSRADHVAIRLLDGRVLVAGGTHAEGQAGTMYYSESQLTSAELFDPATGTWSAAGDLHDSQHAQNPVLLPDGRVIFDGREVFDPATNSFTLLPASYKGFSGFGTGALLLPDGRILMSSVHADAKPLLYDPAKNLCTGVSAPYPSGNSLGGGYQSMTLLQDGTALLIGRQSSGVATPMAEADRFDPQAELSITPAMGFTNVGVPLSLHVTGPNASGVTWTSGGGTVITDGTFMSSAVGFFPVTATAPDGTKATIMVDVSPVVKVLFDPFTYPGIGAILNAGVAVPFHAHVLNTPDQRLIWSIQEGAAAGTITANGVFTAASAGTWHVIATSVADPTQSAIFTITTAPPIALSVQPQQLTVLPGQEVTFTITEPTGQTAISLDAPGILYPNFVGIITYKAPITPGTYNLMATSALDPTKSVVMVLTVVPVTDFFITPSSMVMRPGGSSTFKAYARSSEGLQDVSDRVSWSVTNGSFIAGKDAYGIYRTIYFAPSSPGTSTVTAVMSGTLTSAQSLVTILPADAFAAAGLLTSSRQSHTMTRLLDGRILIAGGGNSTAEIYDPTTKSFTALVTTMQQLRAGHTATLLPDGKVLIVGGNMDSTGVLAEVYDPATQTFSPTGGPPFHRRSDHFAVPLPNGRILIAGGLDGSSQRTLEIYEPVSGIFSLAGALNDTRSASKGAATLMADGRVLFVGPASGAVGGLPGSSEVYDFRTGTSTSAANPNLASWSPSLIPAADGGVWSFAGDFGTPTVDSAMEWFDPGSGTFTIGPNPIVNDPVNVTELVDGSIWASGWHADYPNSKNLHGMRFFPGSGVYADAIYFPTSLQSSALKTILLPAGDVLVTGADGFGNSKTAGLLVFDTVPNAVILPRRITLLGGRSWPFQASSTGLGNAGFTWSIQEGPGGGSINSQGVYTAPFSPGTYHIVVVSNADGATQATAVVDVISGAEVSIVPALIQLQPGATRSFQASLVGLSDTRVNWASSGGNISSDGVFTAPMTEGTCTVTATSAAQADYSGTATVVVKAGAGGGGIPLPVLNSFTADTPAVLLGQPVRFSWSTSYATYVQLECMSYVGYSDQFRTMDVTRLSSISIYPLRTETYRLKVTNPSGVITSPLLSVSLWTNPVSLSITPQSVSLYVGQSQQFGFSLSAPTNRLVWSATGGGITTAGRYTAPSTPGTYQVSVQSVDDPSKSATATVVVMVNPFSLALSPVSLSLPSGGTKQFGYSFTGPLDAVLDWAATGGTVTSNGFYTAPVTPGTYTVTVVCSALNLSASATITVVPISMSITPTQVTLVPGQTQQFSWSVNGGGVTFSVLEAGGGSITQTGLYTTPVVAGVYTVQITSQVDASQTVQAKVTVNPITITIDPPAVTLEVNQAMRFGASLNNGGWVWSATGGVVDDQGHYLAPVTPGSYTVTVQSLLDPTKTATSQVTVVAASTLKLDPNEFTISSGGTIPLTLVGVPDGATVTWAVKASDDSPGGGTVSVDNRFMAGIIPGAYIITAIESSAGNRAYAQVRIISHRILPEEALVGLGQQLQFTAAIYDASSSVSWSISENNGGTIDANGLYTAPLQQGQYHVIAQTSSGNLASVTVMVGPPDGFTVAPEVNIQEAGTYEIKLRLKASNGKTTESLTSGDYPAGIATPTITFSQGQLRTDLGVDGPYTFDQVVLNQLLDGELLEVDRKDALGVSGPYAIAEGDKPWISIGAIQNVIAEDSNGNGLIDTLKVQVSVDVICDGTYFIGSGLVAADGAEVGRYHADLLLKRGTNTITLVFDGKQLYASGKEGPYGLAALTVAGSVTQSVDLPGVVTGYTLNQFEH